jgi:hypothetical protein
MEPEPSVTSMTEACSTGTATVASGRASAVSPRASASAMSAAGTWRRQPGLGTSLAIAPAAGKRTA